MSEPCEKCGADISHQGEQHANCEEVMRLRGDVEFWKDCCEAARKSGKAIHDDRKRLLNLVRCHRNQSETDEAILELAKVVDGYYGEE